VIAWLRALAVLVLFALLLALDAGMWWHWAPFEFGGWPTLAQADACREAGLTLADCMAIVR